jgi:translation initiation factor IF-3
MGLYLIRYSMIKYISRFCPLQPFGQRPYANRLAIPRLSRPVCVIGGQLADKDLRINEQIRVREVRLIDDKNEQRGIIPTLEAIKIAKELGLDLVEVAPQSIPPVCKLLNYGKYKFEQEKKIKDARKHTKVTEIKEIRMQPKIAGHDLDFKSAHVREFLEQGNKVKVTIRFRGRELAHTEIGEEVLKKVLARLEGFYVMEKLPMMEGRFMSMVLQPKASIVKKQPIQEAATPETVNVNENVNVNVQQP